MFLKALTLKGFKSFAEATTMQLEPGVTVVVGPNGSGKSNVVDAIAWVLGAQAPSAVRSQKMDDVIFAGTAKRPALGRAEVSLTIDNSSGILPIEFTEVRLSRTLFRTGESEYAINGVPCRLLDLQDLLSDAGVGRQQHVIVSQGQIDAVLNARPEERRAIIEEAAGVLKYRKRKEKAERRLEATEGNLLRVQDLLREVRRQLRPLERQADAARRHGALVAELGALRLFLAGREIAGLRTRLTSLAGDHLAADTKERELRAELARLDTAVMAAEAELSARGDTDVSDSLVRVEQLRERARGLANVITERRRAMERDRGQLMDAGVVANLEAEGARLAAELREVVEGLSALAPEAEELTEADETFARERAETQAVIDAASGGGTAAAASAAAEVRGELRSMRAGVERAELEHRRAVTRLEQLVVRNERLAAEVDRLKAECEQAEGVEAPLVSEVEAAEARRIAAEAAADAATDAHQVASGELARWQARAEALALALDSARARAGAERLAGLDGVVGTLLELVEVDDGWEAAFEAAAGDAMLAVVVADPSAARRALAHLDSGDAHGAVLSLGAGEHHAGASASAGVGEPVRAHVRSSDQRVSRLLDGLLAGAVRVVGWEAALDASLAHPNAVVVTDDGHRFSPTGWRLGVAGGGATAAALDDAQRWAESARTELDLCDERVSVAKAELAAARQAEADLGRRLDMNDAKFTAAADALTRVQGERRETAAEIESVERAAGELADRVQREQARIAELDALLPALEADEEAEAEAARQRGEARARLEAKAALLISRRRDLEVRNVGLIERQQYLERRLEETERRLAADAAAREEASERRVRVERAIEATDRLAQLVDGHRRTVESELARLHEQRRRQSDEVRAVAQRLDELRRARSATERQLDELRERSRRTEIDEAEARMRLEAAVEGVRRDLETEPEVAEAAELPELPEGISAPARVRDLERELKLMGPINPLALEEFTALQERHSFLEEQLEDVKTTRRELARVIKAVDTEIQTVFAEAFADVSANFTALFGLLFPGGAGSLVLTNPDDLLGTGIEVEAKPSGKNVKKLSLLSGGERSLTALAYLFAVFRSRPSPFYVMDEVEAALDDVNLHRFLGLIHEFRNEAQLLVVSHQKRTMEAADCLLGVTMQPGGSSKVIVEKAGASA
ncbi:MAG: chromosome segregation protein SMC [Acidimicrobiia bacterium]